MASEYGLNRGKWVELTQKIQPNILKGKQYKKPERKTKKKCEANHF